MDISRVKIYNIVEPKELFKFEKLLPRLLFDLPQKEEDYIFSISPISGWIYYSNYKEIRQNQSSLHLPKNETEVKQAISDYISKVNAKILKERKRNTKFNINGIFPDKIILQKIAPVVNDNTGLIDHWVVSYQPYLRGQAGFNGDYFPVLGASIVFRVGNYNKIIGLSLNCRIFGNQYHDILIPKPSLDEKLTHSHEIENEDHGDKDQTRICYYDKGEYIFQNTLCPFYYDLDGHHMKFEPCTKKSMVLDIIEDHHDNKIDLYAGIIGGSGDFQYEWSSWKIEDMESTYKEHGHNSKITFGIGTYTVLLTVTDLRSNIKEQICQLVYGHFENSQSQETKLIV